jgi:hypothetical protein
MATVTDAFSMRSRRSAARVASSVTARPQIDRNKFFYSLPVLNLRFFDIMFLRISGKDYLLTAANSMTNLTDKQRNVWRTRGEISMVNDPGSPRGAHHFFDKFDALWGAVASTRRRRRNFERRRAFGRGARIIFPPKLGRNGARECLGSVLQGCDKDCWASIRAGWPFESGWRQMICRNFRGDGI